MIRETEINVADSGKNAADGALPVGAGMPPMVSAPPEIPFELADLEPSGLPPSSSQQVEAGTPQSPVNLSGAYLALRPERLAAPGAWVEHIPFLMWLIENQAPQVFVELGTHIGNSYCAGCQAVAAFQHSTACYSVDTWLGDQHAGFYDESVFEELSAYHHAKYGAFSRLVRSTFDEALPQFGDGTIDLMHIDGTHTFEAVRHDFESWLPKLAPDGVIIFHDTNVRERGMGVWRLWAGLRARYPSFEFLHGHGLGVLFPKGIPHSLATIANCPGHGQTALIRDHFATLGRVNSLELAKKESLDRQAAAGNSERSQLEELRLQRAAAVARADELSLTLGKTSATLLRHEKSLKTVRARLLNNRPLAKVFRATARLVCRIYKRNNRAPLGGTLLGAPLWSGVNDLMNRANEAFENGHHHQACELYQDASHSGLAILNQLRRNPLTRAVLRGHVVNLVQEQVDAQTQLLQELARTLHRLGGGNATAADAATVFGMDLAFYSAQTGRKFLDGGYAARHYSDLGWKRGLNPHPLFNTNHFVAQNSHQFDDTKDPLAEFQRLLSEGKSPETHPNFSGGWLRSWFWETSPLDLCLGSVPVPSVPLNAEKASEFMKLPPCVAIGVILFHTDPEELGRLLRVLDRAAAITVREGYPPPQILLTDNSHQWSHEDVERIAGTLSTPVQFFPTSTNAGFGAGHNHLMQKAFGEAKVTHYVCLNPDGLLHPHAIFELLEVAAAQSMPAFVEALQIPCEHPKGYDAITLETRWNTAGCLLMPRFLFELVGGFDERFFMYCEDVDLSWRVWEAGYCCLIAPRALFHHRMAERTHNARADQWFLESGRILGDKWNCKRFQLTCERFLIDRGYRASTSELPLIRETARHAAHQHVDFGNMFTFASARW